MVKVGTASVRRTSPAADGASGLHPAGAVGSAGRAHLPRRQGHNAVPNTHDRDVGEGVRVSRHIWLPALRGSGLSAPCRPRASRRSSRPRQKCLRSPTGHLAEREEAPQPCLARVQAGTRDCRRPESEALQRGRLAAHSRCYQPWTRRPRVLDAGPPQCFPLHPSEIGGILADEASEAKLRVLRKDLRAAPRSQNRPQQTYLRVSPQRKSDSV